MPLLYFLFFIVLTVFFFTFFSVLFLSTCYLWDYIDDGRCKIKPCITHIIFILLVIILNRIYQTLSHVFFCFFFLTLIYNSKFSLYKLIVGCEMCVYIYPVKVHLKTLNIFFFLTFGTPYLIQKASDLRK